MHLEQCFFDICHIPDSESRNGAIESFIIKRKVFSIVLDVVDILYIPFFNFPGTQLQHFFTEIRGDYIAFFEPSIATSPVPEQTSSIYLDGSFDTANRRQHLSRPMLNR
ncbi:MAG: hypothetical protein BME93_06390 [Methanosarcinales archaeon Met12]|nr:MAG: hypothetical protein BME93_06390 [Methanosarcinales archaeon Met12]